jgi:purine-binding chemotaxis protein CheW
MLEQVTPVPNAAHFVDGVVFSRGEVVPALNLRAASASSARPTPVDALLVVTPAAAPSAGRRRGARVRLDRSGVDPAAVRDAHRAERQYLEGVANIGDRLILVLNLTEVLTFTDPALEAHA